MYTCLQQIIFNPRAGLHTMLKSRSRSPHGRGQRELHEHGAHGRQAVAFGDHDDDGTSITMLDSDDDGCDLLRLWAAGPAPGAFMASANAQHASNAANRQQRSPATVTHTLGQPIPWARTIQIDFDLEKELLANVPGINVQHMVPFNMMSTQEELEARCEATIWQLINQVRDTTSPLALQGFEALEFKIGICASPAQRYTRRFKASDGARVPSYEDGMFQMWILAAGGAHCIGGVEDFLIQQVFRGSPGCLNIQNGMRGQGPCGALGFLYVVTRSR